jgi:hypothetical protein
MTAALIRQAPVKELVWQILVLSRVRTQNRFPLLWCGSALIQSTGEQVSADQAGPPLRACEPVRATMRAARKLKTYFWRVMRDIGRMIKVKPELEGACQWAGAGAPGLWALQEHAPGSGCPSRGAGMKLRIPNQTRHAFVRLMMCVFCPTSFSRSRTGRLAPFSASVGIAAIR